MKINWKRITTAQLAAVVCSALERHDIQATLVGGACVTLYSQNRYISRDLDFITIASLDSLESPLGELGFKRFQSRMFVHPDCDSFFLDFPAPPLSVGNEAVTKINRIKTRLGTIRLLTPIDCVRDRLAAYFHWDDPQGLEQALMVAERTAVNIARIKKWAISENARQKFDIFNNELLKRRKGRRKQ